MRKAIVLKILLFLLIVLLIAAVSLFIWLRGGSPQVDGNSTVDGISDTIDVYRDDYGVAHIYAKNLNDLYFGQGFVHAQDRFEQMDISRRFAQGRLSEVFGQVTLETDKYFRNIGLNRTASRTLEHYRTELPDTFGELEAYTAGVNAYLTLNREKTFAQKIVGLSGSWEFEPWTIYDSLSFAVYMAWSFSASWDGEYTSTQIMDAVDLEVKDAIFPNYSDHRPAAVETAYDVSMSRPLKDAVGSPVLDRSILEKLRPTIPFLNLRNQSGYSLAGSNAWVIAAEHTINQKPILANDPHLWVSAPSYWHQMSLHSPELNVTGFSMPGGPGILIGRNRHIAWGITNALVDVQDVYIEKVNPDNQNEYEYEGKWLEFTQIKKPLS